MTTSLIKLLKSKGFAMKRKIDHSKTNYPRGNEENLVLFNAMIYEKELYYKIKNLEFPSVIRATKKGNSEQEKIKKKKEEKKKKKKKWWGGDFGFYLKILKNCMMQLGGRKTSSSRIKMEI